MCGAQTWNLLTGLTVNFYLKSYCEHNVVSTHLTVLQICNNHHWSSEGVIYFPMFAQEAYMKKHGT